MYKLKKVMIYCITILLFIILVWSFLSWFSSPGVHIFWRFAHLDIQRNCYIIDPYSTPGNPTVIEKSQLTIRGNINGFTHEFEGTIAVSAYPISYNDDPPYIGTVFYDAYEDFWFVSQSVNYVYISETTGLEPKIPDVNYFLRVDPWNGNNLALLLSFPSDVNGKGTSVYTVCADSEAEALELFYFFYCDD